MKRPPRFEIVRTNVRSQQGWHARFIAGNGRIVWTTEQYDRRRSAEDAILLLARQFWVDATFVGSNLLVVDMLMGAPGIEVRDVDDRYVPPPVELRPPFYRTTVRPILDLHTRKARSGDPEEFWHDREYHYRQCTGTVSSVQSPPWSTPPVGTMVWARMGEAKYTGPES